MESTFRGCQGEEEQDDDDSTDFLHLSTAKNILSEPIKLELHGNAVAKPVN